MPGAFVRGEFDLTGYVEPGKKVALAVLVSPQPHPGTPHEHTVAHGIGKNGGETALDGTICLSTIGWDWLMAVRDRDPGIRQSVTLTFSGPVLIKNPFVTSIRSDKFESIMIASMPSFICTRLPISTCSAIGWAEAQVLTAMTLPISMASCCGMISSSPILEMAPMWSTCHPISTM